MSKSLSSLLKATYARNLQLEDLLKSVGLDADDPAVAKDLPTDQARQRRGSRRGNRGGVPGRRDGEKRRAGFGAGDFVTYGADTLVMNGR
jgi:hypothetical protein